MFLGINTKLTEDHSSYRAFCCGGIVAMVLLVTVTGTRNIDGWWDWLLKCSLMWTHELRCGATIVLAQLAICHTAKPLFSHFSVELW